jgi:hypothetical protein
VCLKHSIDHSGIQQQMSKRKNCVHAYTIEEILEKTQIIHLNRNIDQSLYKGEKNLKSGKKYEKCISCEIILSSDVKTINQNIEFILVA